MLFKVMRVCLLLFFVFVFNISNAQKSNTGNWFIYFGNQAINKKWNWYNEVQYRNYNFAGDLQQLILRTGIGYNLSENNNNILLGYGYIDSKRYPTPNVDVKTSTVEHRLYQQFITKQNYKPFFVQHRYRLEERFLQSDFQMRFRYFLAVNIPLNNKTMVKNTIYASAYNEIFLNTEKPIFDRNRLYGAVGFMFNKYIKAEIGIMAQTQENTNRNQFQIVVFNNLPF
jgi:Protein of unknown function (DUF2490)